MASIQELLSHETALQILRATLVLVAGLVIARIAAAAIHRVTRPAMGLHRSAVLRRLVFYVLVAITAMVAMHELGLSFGVLLGAAGVLSVAVGIASQTSASNLVSGIFLVAEKSFELGDNIRVGELTGEVLSIDLLSVKLRTFDNLFVRVPNETLIKSNIVNLTRFPIRRVDFRLGIAYKEDIGRVRDILVGAADAHPLCLDQPRPLIIFQGFGDSSLNLQFSVWATRENYLELLNTMPERIKRSFDENGIEIPFPHRSLYAGSLTEPFPVRFVDDGAIDPGQSDSAAGRDDNARR